MVYSLNLGERSFRTKEFYRELQDLITPAGISFYQSDWDDSLPAFFHNTLGNYYFKLNLVQEYHKNACSFVILKKIVFSNKDFIF